ncbi:MULTISPECIES: glycosyltransferase family 2 protein [unclassified Microbacterium]|uniref:glycosyltransferase family 2 protein n=1 Tax=unclassified Microbacterium TaxID=2609290 RepID=UPI0038634966
MTEQLGPVSVALCTFNGGAFVAEQIESILNQDHRVAEIIVADDGSTDDTLSIVAAYVEEARKLSVQIRVFEAEGGPLGPTRNFERAISKTSHQLVALSDQDDVWALDRVSKGVRALRETGAWLCVSNAELVDAVGHPIGRTMFQSMSVLPSTGIRQWRTLLMKANRFPGMTYIFVKDDAEKVLPVPTSWMHDYWLVISALAADRLTVIDDPLVRYRQHASNAIGVTENVVPRSGAKVSRALSRSISGDKDARRWLNASAQFERFTFGDRELRVLFEEKIAFERERSTLPVARWRRAWPILRMLLQGRYRRLGVAGVKGAARDLAARY